jgi:hypothetical protein
VVHILTGVAVLVTAWTTIGLGLSEWTTSVVTGDGRRTIKALFILYVPLPSVLLPVPLTDFRPSRYTAASSSSSSRSSPLLLLVHTRHHEGRSLSSSLFGLRRRSASPHPHLGRHFTLETPPSTSESEGSGDEAVFGLTGGRKTEGEREVKLRKEVWNSRVQSRWSR